MPDDSLQVITCKYVQEKTKSWEVIFNGETRYVPFSVAESASHNKKAGTIVFKVPIWLVESWED